MPVPVPRSRIVDLYFLEHRAKLLDIAAFLDRLDRAADDTPGGDFRVRAFLAGIDVLRDGRPERARRLLELLSDPSTTPIPKAPMKGAMGAVELDRGDASDRTSNAGARAGDHASPARSAERAPSGKGDATDGPASSPDRRGAMAPPGR